MVAFNKLSVVEGGSRIKCGCHGTLVSFSRRGGRGGVRKEGSHVSL